MRRLARVRRRQLQVTASTDPAYLDGLRAAIIDETQRAAHFKHVDDREQALQCLRRGKLMKDELAELELEQRDQQQHQQQQHAHQQLQMAAATKRPDAADFRSVDNICSVAVVDWELSLLTNANNDELQAMRKTELDIKKQMIIMAIEMGSLTMEQYANALTARIVVDKQLAKALNEAGRKEDALYALRRAKVMEKEMIS